jgi:toxin FitB
MSKYLIDTNVLSEQVKPEPNPNVLQWLASNSAMDAYISIITIAEIEQGVALLGQTKRAKRYDAWLKNIELEFSGRILPLDRGIATTWAKLTARAIRTGRTLGYADSWIVATALTYDLVVVTHNVDDFDGFVKVLDPW